MKKKINLKFIGTGLTDNHQACVSIYDNFKNIVYQGSTYDGRLVLYLKNNSVYSIVATSYGRSMRNVFYVSDYDDTYVFSFIKNKRTNLRTITFFLRDANYDNLLIKKGEIFLWQKQ